MSGPIEAMLGEKVVLDTLTRIVYLGTLAEVTDLTYVLKDADLHDCTDGFASKEEYTAAAARGGISVNRKRVVVMRSVVISLSRLEDVAAE